MIPLAAAALAATVVLTDDAVTVPPQIPAGVTTFTVENHGTQPHGVRIVRLTDKHTADDFAAFLKTGGAPPEWVKTAGGAAPLAPNVSEEYATALEPGTYAVVDGERFAPLTVVAGSEPSRVRRPAPADSPVAAGVRSAGPADPPIAADIEVRAFDHGFQFGAPIEGAHPMWHVRNTGTEPHQAILVRLPERVSEFAVRNWIASGSRGDMPGEARGGILEIPVNGEAWFQVDLPTGRYLLICGELEQEGRHFDLGMIYRFTIE